MTRLPPLDPAVAATRSAVRRALRQATTSGGSATGHSDPAPLALVALSGGADSLALAAAVAFETARLGWRGGAVIVDHQLQADSAQVAARAAAQAETLGLDPVVVRTVTVGHGDANGPEAAARRARYRALEDARQATGAHLLLTAHTRDDQAEQVLLALARGSGTRALAGIPPARGPIRRPFLALSRHTTERACAAQGLDPWLDPHNDDHRFARVRARREVLPALERHLGPGVSASLARTAELAREDADALDALAARVAADLSRTDGDLVSLDVARLAMEPPAIRHRVIRRVARDRFGSHLSRTHTLQVAALVTDWRGQGPIHVPGATVERADGVLRFRGAG